MEKRDCLVPAALILVTKAGETCPEKCDAAACFLLVRRAKHVVFAPNSLLSQILYDHLPEELTEEEIEDLHLRVSFSS